MPWRPRRALEDLICAEERRKSFEAASAEDEASTGAALLPQRAATLTVKTNLSGSLESSSVKSRRYAEKKNS